MGARIVVTEFTSLDGVMEAPGGEPFKYPGWSFEFDRGDDGNQFKLEETRQADALLIGRRTYESFAGAWPQREGEFADKFNSMPKFVVSTTLKDPEWNNTTVLDSGDATAAVHRCRSEVGAARASAGVRCSSGASAGGVVLDACSLESGSGSSPTSPVAAGRVRGGRLSRRRRRGGPVGCGRPARRQIVRG